MRTLWIGMLVLGILSGMGSAAFAATVYWEDDFSSGTPFQQPGGWGDDSQDGNFNAEIAYSCTASLAAVTRTADSTWGRAMGPSQTVDVALYPQVRIMVAAVSGSVSWKLGIQEDEGSYVYHDLNTSTSATGTFAFNYASVMGWSSGVHRFKVVLVVEGDPGQFVVIDAVRIYTDATIDTPTYTPTLSPTPTRTITPTPTMTPPVVIVDAWKDDFIGTFNQQPRGWEDATDTASFNAHIAYASATSLAAITRTAGTATWGKVLSPIQYCDPTFYPWLEIRVSQLLGGAKWKVGIQESGGNYEYVDLCAEDRSDTGTAEFHYQSASGWSGLRTFQVQVVVAGGPTACAMVDWVKIFAKSPPPTLTPTPPATVSWSAVIPGTGLRPEGWIDESLDAGKNLSILYTNLGQTLSLWRTAQSTYGVVSSPAIRTDVTRYPLLHFSVTGITEKTKWKVGIQETTGDKCYADLGVATGLTGAFTWNYAAAVAAQNLIPWTGVHDFQVVLVVEGAAASQVDFNDLKIFGYGAEPPTATPTLTPWVDAQKVLAYPNPGRDRVTFAYQALGEVQVTLNIYQLTGQRVASVQETRSGQPGQVLETVWDAVNAPPGIYFCHLKVTGAAGHLWAESTKKIAITK